MDVISLVAPYATGLVSGAVSGFIQFWTKLKDENNDGVTNLKDFDGVKFGKTVVISAIAGAWLSGTGAELDVVTLGVLSAGVEKVVSVALKALSQQFLKRNELLPM